ncbi:hypothetical protein NSP_44380 [Nodularia spumigena CCY9414]|nr:hypothetical protein NSP_44380 [Nodularia spumigena CCY9414]
MFNGFQQAQNPLLTAGVYGSHRQLFKFATVVEAVILDQLIT